MSQAIPVIVNATAGKGYDESQIEAIAAAFEAAGAAAEIMPVRVAAELVKTAQRAVKEGHPVVVGGGGDGTMNAVACAVAGSDSAMGVLPLGTLNHFAKDLGIPLELEEAARVIVANHQARVDVAEVNGRIFINNSSFGLYPELVRVRERQRRHLGRNKWHALFWATLTVLRSHPKIEVQLEIDGKAEKRRTPLVFIGNNEYVAEGLNVGSRERLDAGKLSIYLTRRQGRLGLLGLAVRALTGTLLQERDFEALTAAAARIDTRHRALPVATDGEVTIMDMPLEYRIRPGALRVVVPAPTAEAAGEET
jgi:YegS/Rv2252/BmrU family lipid kinase